MEEISEKTILNYLLGKLPETAEADILAKCFGSDAAEEKYEMVRDNLIEAYLKDRLNRADREKFETHFLAEPYHQELFEFSNTIRANLANDRRLAQIAAQADEAEKTGLFSFSGILVPAMSVLIVLAGLFIWIIVKNNGNEIVQNPPPYNTPAKKSPEIVQPVNLPAPEDSSLPEANQNRVSPAPAKSPQASPEAVQPPTTFVAFTLPVGVKGEADEETLRINREAKRVDLKTSRPVADFKTYRAVITEKSSGATVFSREFEKLPETDNGTKILIAVPANVFRSGEHTFIFEGKRDDASFEALKGTKRDFVVKKEK